MIHHAYFYEGPFALLEALADDARERFGFKGDKNPDVHIVEEEKFGIDESRSLVESAGLKSLAGRALFVVGVASVTVQAQQALLKLLEEPQAGTVFVLLVPHGTLLPTVRSRMMAYPYQGESSVSLPRTLLGKKFLKSNQKERSDDIAKLLKDDEGVKERVREFVLALEAELYAQVRPARSHRKEILVALEDVQKVRDYLRDTAPSHKMLLEHLALTIPQL